MLIFTSLCLLLWLQFKGVESKVIPLGFYEESIDDMYSDCKDKMEKMVFDKYSEELTEKGYGTYWESAKYLIQEDNTILTSQEMQAIVVYTGTAAYSALNRAVRSGGNTYGTSFKFHILHFLLASALQKLKKADSGICYTTYRRSAMKFKIMQKKMRFGSFASSSLQPDMTQFGQESCFKIETCHGAAVEQYSAYPAEREVLIPPYEVFTFVKRKVAELRDCRTVYVLKSAGTHSNLDCNLVK
ncbi:LOW QUALITY PROTEIN: ecto-ADP-ribosyltransferase 5-like [Fundulus heteroclitus]|uniref:LOW QUALITY PROTEIN: ecto-ADP-ribosyltransferase 5-like n=1 Tax=Fundulus heteroclitus TaxID=8078 RepID=UPI00165B36AF|nr:LOW QUALITY PROTEIN: ecto-ADP-ribosyltransferase 5-like [Fundulus heteroclitus]